MSLYQKLSRLAWKTGEYKVSEDAVADGKGLTGAALRDFLRSKMEWIVAREALEPTAASPQSKEGRMKLAQYVKFREEKFGGVLFETKSEKVFTLSQTGAAILREIVAGGVESEVVARLRERFADKSGALEKEAKEFIADLRAKGLVTE
ncbi:MAG: PqqD family protein [Elusimicrobia bacterium]|nr:PqqD family protein [Elusimicrobiota bacterium]